MWMVTYYALPTKIRNNIIYIQFLQTILFFKIHTMKLDSKNVFGVKK